MTLSDFVYTELPSTVDPSRPLIYMWEIRDGDGALVECYVGKASRGAARPRRHYANNVRRLRAGLSWHGQSMGGYRAIHHRLSAAADAGHRVTLRLLCNVGPDEDINAVERLERARHGGAGQ